MKRRLLDYFRKMLHSPLVTVVIPMYNCEGFVKELLEGLSLQSYRDFEVICVIDGATDNTAKRVKDFCKKDARFHMLVQKHQGAGAARNTGLRNAKGKYILWLDADDAYSSALIEKLLKAAENSDADMTMCLARVRNYRDGSVKELHGFNPDIYPRGEAKKPQNPLVLRQSIDVGIQFKLFRTNFVRKNRLRFSHTRVANDWFFDHASRICAERIAAVHETLVEYRQYIHASSITSNRSQHLGDSISAANELWRWLNQTGRIPEYEEYFYSAFDGGLGYNIRFQSTEEFAQAIAKTINEEMPWSGMDDSTLLNKLKLSIGGTERFRKMYEKAIRKLRKEDLYQISEKKEEHSIITGCIHALDTIRLVREISKDAYGRAGLAIPKISVIIPVYNAERYMERCIESLAGQTLKEMEFIFVDDCSTDGTMKKARDFAGQDLRVRVYQNGENMGAGASRNHGMDLASGEYLAFMDVDDYICGDFYERLYLAAAGEGKHDIAKGSRKKVDLRGVQEAGSDALNIRIRKNLARHSPLYTSFNYEHQTAIFKHSLFDHGTRYGTTAKGEDVLFLFRICNKTNDIVFDDEAVYYYVVQKEGEAVRDYQYRAHHDGILAIRETIDWIYERRDPNSQDCLYIARKLLSRHKAYLNAMKNAPHLEEQYGNFLNEIVDAVNHCRVPEMILDQRKDLRELYETASESLIKHARPYTSGS